MLNILQVCNSKDEKQSVKQVCIRKVKKKNSGSQTIDITLGKST